MARIPKPWFRKDRKSWFVTISGKRHNLGDNKDQAFAKYHQMMAGSHIVSQPVAPPTQQKIATDDASGTEFSIGYVIDKYLEFVKENRANTTYDAKVKSLSNWLAENPGTKEQRISTFKPFQLQQWIDKKTTWGPTTKHTALKTIQACFRWAKKQGFVDVVSIDDYEKPTPKKREGYATPEDYKFLLDHLDEKDSFRDLIIFCWETGCGPQEVKHVTKESIDLERGTVTMENTKQKGPRTRTIMLSSQALEVVRRLSGEFETGPIFRSRRGNPWNKNSINSRFHRIKKKTGRGYCQYLFRHGFATDLLINDVDIGTVSALMGHTSTRMVSDTYGHLQQNPEFLRKKLELRTRTSVVEDDKPKPSDA